MKSLQILTVVISLLITSCSTLFNGSLSDVKVNSDPSEAQIIVNGSNMGKTPTLLQLKRGETHIIEIKKEGYRTYRVTTTNSITGWFWGNILCGGILGFIIDLATGNAYDVHPKYIVANLDPGTGALEHYMFESFTSIIIRDSNGNNVSHIDISWD